MIPKSLKLRLALTAAVSLALALVLAGIGIVALFERHAYRRAESELNVYLKLLAGDIKFAGDGAIELGWSQTYPRFNEPLSGLYWQIEDLGAGKKLRSRSLWDHLISLPAPLPGAPAAGVTGHVVPASPRGGELLVRERLLSVPSPAGEQKLRLAVAIEMDEMIKARQAFANEVTASLALLAVALLIASWIQIAVGLRPLEAVRRSVMNVRAGRLAKLTADQPVEVMPLVNEVNSLLEAQKKAIDRAKATAGDLAHGLKTPLTVLAADVERLRQRGEAEIADEIADITQGMQRHISWELSRARLRGATAARGATASVPAVTSGIVRTLARSPRGLELDWHIDVPANLHLALRQEDLAELLGVLLDNAAKWASQEVWISVDKDDPGLIVIEDDGPGVTSGLLEKLGRRGVRLDQTVEGSGLGLAIARDIVETYEGSLRLGERRPHGFRVEIALPMADPVTEPVSRSRRRTM